MKKATESNRPLCMMMFDIDHFKIVNDTYGHQAGDEVLRCFTNTLKNSFRVTDLIARYGGEEFAVLLCDTPIDEAMLVAERVRASVEALEFRLPTHAEPLKKTTSIGVTQYKTDEVVTSFIERADSALYEAKETGRNKIVKKM